MKQVKTISTAEARQRFAEITDEVRTKNISYSIVRHGKEVARLVAPQILDAPADKDFLVAIQHTIKKYDKALAELAK